MRSDYHVAENVFCPASGKHHWLVENATNTVVCAHSTEAVAQRCCDTFDNFHACSVIDSIPAN